MVEHGEQLTKVFDKWVFPQYEEHLQEWMNTMRDIRHGRLTYQANKYDLCKTWFKHRRRAIDVGAHVGLWAWQMIHDFEVVEAFEPHPLHQHCFEENILLAPDIPPASHCELHKIALGNTSGMVGLVTETPHSSGDTRVVLDATTQHMAEIRPLDDFAFTDVDFVKVDCEGYELPVVMGAEKTLLACKPVVVVEQKHDFHLRYGGEKLEAVRYLESLGARVVADKCEDFIMVW